VVNAKNKDSYRNCRRADGRTGGATPTHDRHLCCRRIHVRRSHER
jgi:hypothetical protein